MSAVSMAFSMKKSRAYQAILGGGLIVGILDITAAFVTNGWRGISPIRILQSIASGLLGMGSYKGGVATAALGAVLHFIIATGAAAVYYLVSRKLKFLVERAIVCGLIYGVAVYWFMNMIVLPLSAFPHKISYSLVTVVTGLIVHTLCVGLPISLTVRRISK